MHRNRTIQGRRIKAALFSVAVAVLHTSPLTLAEEPAAVRFATAYYADAREFSTLSVMISSNRLPFGLSMWGFSDFHGDQGRGQPDLTYSFSEYRVSHGGIARLTGINGLGLQAEIDALSGKGNDTARFGVTYRHGLSLPWLEDASKQGWLQWRWLPYQTDNAGYQGSLIFNVPISERMGVTGFADYNVRDDKKNVWVAEPELYFQVAKRTFALIEYRYNQFESFNPTLDGAAFAIGFRYHFSQ